MAVDKILNKIQTQINELAPTLELFIEESIQPSVSDCDSLQAQLAKLLETIAVYKYNKLEKEISPSFNIHSKISNVEPVVEKKEEPKEVLIEEIKNTLEDDISPIVVDNTQTPGSNQALLVGINDKFRFINELFTQNAGEYNVAIEQLGSVNSWKEAEVYLNSLKALYGWKENSEVVNYLYALVKKRFA